MRGIASQGLFIILVPFVFQLVFIVLLVQFLKQAETAATNEARARIIIGYTSACQYLSLTNTSVACGLSLAKNAKYREYFANTLDQVKETADILKSICQQQEEIKAYELFEGKQVEVLRSNLALVRLCDQGKWSEAQKQVETMQTDEKWREVRDSASQLIALEHKITLQQEAVLSQARQNISTLVLGGVAADSVIMATLLVFFSRNITRRLKVMTRNVLKFGNEEQLLPQLSGHDEIAQLDRAFHEMAVSVTEATKQIRENELRVRSILENMLVGVFVSDEKGKIEIVNPQTERMFGYSIEELWGKPMSLLLVSNKQSDLKFADLLDRARNHVTELSATRQDGQKFPVEVTVTEYDTAEGKRLITNVLDVSERKEIERVRREFVAIVSHELRTPLASILVGLRLLSSGAYPEMPEKALKTADRAEQNCERLLSLVNDLLEFERMEAGMLMLEWKPTSAISIAERAVEAVQNLADNKQVTLERIGSDVELRADGDRLVQVVINLLSNAIKFAPEASTITLDLTLKEIAKQKEIEFSVRDQGRGIPEEFRARIFQKFQQAEHADAKEKHGSGLGLAIARNIVEMHGGQIGVDSEAGKGSRFWFRIPLGK